MSYRRWMSRGRRLAAISGGGVVLLCLGWPSSTWGQDPPHWESDSIVIDCTSQCHVPHNAAGGALNQSASNVNLCQSCHNSSGLASDLPIDTAGKAERNVSGVHHAFDVSAVNAEINTQLPLDVEMSLRVVGGNVVCSTCHNQHRAESAFGGESRVGASRKTTALGSTGDVQSGGEFTGPEGLWYLVEIVTAGNDATAAFCYSKDNGLSWLPTGCDPPGTTTPNLGAGGGAAVGLDNGVNVTFAPGSYLAQERWEFAASWPFLRASFGEGGSSFCGDCHRDWVMDHIAVEQWNGGSVKSHPVGVALGVNGAGYDRSEPLDGDGTLQASGASPDVDGNATNDFRLFDVGNEVECLTCHGVHYVDSNTQTVDKR